MMLGVKHTLSSYEEPRKKLFNISRPTWHIDTLFAFSVRMRYISLFLSESTLYPYIGSNFDGARMQASSHGHRQKKEWYEVIERTYIEKKLKRWMLWFQLRIKQKDIEC